ncbi:MAG TPA: sigma-54 dependent transcriptional regulator, partial [Acidobacteriaceae bacterium]|nr:sigma-54 dependent transcriptional regulator [Acidobacteriaceae bacterium]
IVMTAFATVGSAVEAMRKGAGNYLTKPFTMEGLTSVLDESSRRLNFDLESRRLRERMRTARGMGKLIGTSAGMEKVYRILSKVAFSHHPVLIVGESGTGKELVARAIHTGGANAAKPFVAVDCSSLAPTLIESELFGHVKGAYTGANRAREGLLTAANGGTVFLDEIGELPPEMQSRLLRALQEKEVRPVGSSHAVPFTARVLAATNRDLTAMVAQGQFRKDLYFRLNVVNLRIPPLRERRDDIPLLAQFFLEQVERERAKPTASRTRRCSCCSNTTGRAMCASSNIPSSAPARSPQDPCCTPSICPHSSRISMRTGRRPRSKQSRAQQRPKVLRNPDPPSSPSRRWKNRRFSARSDN